MQRMNQQSFVTDQYARIAFGKTVREYPFISCSDSPFTEVIPAHHLFIAFFFFLTRYSPNVSACRRFVRMTGFHSLKKLKSMPR